jgi:hypothetical protein
MGDRRYARSMRAVDALFLLLVPLDVLAIASYYPHAWKLPAAMSLVVLAAMVGLVVQGRKRAG